MAVVVRVRLRVRLPDPDRRRVHDERAQTGVRFQQHGPRAVHTDAVAVRVRRNARRIQPGVRRGRERRDRLRRTARHRGPGAELCGRAAGHKRDDRGHVHQRFAVHRGTDHVPTGTYSVYGVGLADDRKIRQDKDKNKFGLRLSWRRYG